MAGGPEHQQWKAPIHFHVQVDSSSLSPDRVEKGGANAYAKAELHTAFLKGLIKAGVFS